TRTDFLKGPVGEMVVTHCLADLPDDYVVINHLATLHGTLDHVVIGPTGVYIIETRNWRGLITADGHGDILVNGRQPQKPVIRLLLHQILNVRDQVVLVSARKHSAPEMPVFKGLVVFPAASVEARLGTTGSAFCLNENQVYDFIVRNKWNDELDSSRIKRLTRAFLALAKADRESLWRESLPVASAASNPSQSPRPDAPQSVFIS
ncbi:MAG TPA: nuclease-related domain-containing protein, partial [Verrucomicrobiae bacterium]|nr:nuclease-related domain-containing protein [Verrucomicrobiae bacterium]